MILMKRPKRWLVRIPVVGMGGIAGVSVGMWQGWTSIGKGLLKIDESIILEECCPVLDEFKGTLQSSSVDTMSLSKLLGPACAARQRRLAAQPSTDWNSSWPKK